MMKATVLVVGGYGGTGKFICRWLLQSTEVDLIIAGRNLEAAQTLAIQLNQDLSVKRAIAVFADASDYQSLVRAFAAVTLVVDAVNAPTRVEQIAKAALESNVDYLDFHFDPKFYPMLTALAPQLLRKGRCFITQAGLHPGMPATLVRYAAPGFEVYTKAMVGMVMNQKIERAESIVELIDMVVDFKTETFRDGEWRPSSNKDVRKINFGSRFGNRTCYPMYLEEMRLLPTHYPLTEAGMYVAGFNWFVDYVVFPMASLCYFIKKGLLRNFLASLMRWGLNTFGEKEQGVSMVLVAAGEKEGKQVTVHVVAEHMDAYEFTAIPIVACIKQYLAGNISKPGLWMMGHVVEPQQLIDDLQKMGVKVIRSEFRW